MSWGYTAVAGATLIGGMMSADAAKSAANSQSSAADRASAAQERMFNKQVELQAPFRYAGLKANNKLMQLLGLSTDVNTPNVEDFIRQSVGSAYDNGYRIGNNNRDQTIAGAIANYQRGDYGSADNALKTFGYQPDANASADPEYGSLLRSFGMQDFQADPGYAFRQSEGMKGVENSAAARGGLLSGAALKAIQKYGQDLASQEYGNAYQRFNADQTNKYNRLAGIVNTAQVGTNVLTDAAQKFGDSSSKNILAAGDARASGIVGSASAMNDSIGKTASLYQQNELMKLIRKPGASNSFVSGYGYGTSEGE